MSVRYPTSWFFAATLLVAACEPGAGGVAAMRSATTVDTPADTAASRRQAEADGFRPLAAREHTGEDPAGVVAAIGRALPVDSLAAALFGASAPAVVAALDSAVAHGVRTALIAWQHDSTKVVGAARADARRAEVAPAGALAVRLAAWTHETRPARPRRAHSQEPAPAGWESMELPMRQAEGAVTRATVGGREVDGAGMVGRHFKVEASAYHRVDGSGLRMGVALGFRTGVKYCPDAAGISAGELEIQVAMYGVTTGGTTRLELQWDGATTGQVSDAAWLTGYDADVRQTLKLSRSNAGAASLGGSLRSRGLDIRSKTAGSHYVKWPEEGEPVAATLEPLLGKLSRLMHLVIGGDYEAAQRKWRGSGGGGVCVEVALPKAAAPELDLGETADFVAQAKHRQDGAALPVAVLAEVPAVGTVTPANAPHPGPAPFTYVAPKSGSPQAGTFRSAGGGVMLSSVSRRGIGRTYVPFAFGGGAYVLRFDSVIEEKLEGGASMDSYGKEVELLGMSVTKKYHVRASIPLRRSADGSSLEGSGPVSYVSFSAKGRGGTLGFYCGFAPVGTEPGTLTVLRAEVDVGDAANPEPKIVLWMDPGEPTETHRRTGGPECSEEGDQEEMGWVDAFSVFHSDEQGEEAGRVAFRLAGWRSGDAGALARKTYQRTNTTPTPLGVGTTTERTTVEIWSALTSAKR